MISVPADIAGQSKHAADWLDGRKEQGPSPVLARAKRHPACALQGIAARWLSAHYKTIARFIARAIARGLGFVTPCPNKRDKNAYFFKVSDASSTACDAVNVRKDCQHFGPPLWVVLVEERGPFGGPSPVFLLRVCRPTVFVGHVGKKGPRV